MENVQVVGLGMAALDLILRTVEFPSWEGGVRTNAAAIASFQERCGHYLDLFGASGRA